jgi:truncated hemoglobin YjbI
MTMAKRIYREASEATKQLQSLRKQGILNPNYQKPRSEETKEKISLKMKEYWSGIESKNNDVT